MSGESFQRGADTAQKHSEPSLEDLERNVIEQITEANECDVLYYNGPIARPYDEAFISTLAARQKRRDVLLILFQ